MDPKEFWSETNKFATKEKMDKILACMYMMLNKTKENNRYITREYLNSLGEDINFFPGIKEWFERINTYGDELGLKIEHYIISSGLKEIIEGSSIGKCFKEIYASEFLYDENGNAIWPKISVNYTTKTQFLSRINKGVLDISDDKSLNRKILDDNRRISTKNMIYLGDGFTDIPSMRMAREGGGYAIAVYQNNDKKIAKDLLNDNRIDFYAQADYQEGSEIDTFIKIILEHISIKSKLNNIHKEQMNETKEN